MEKDDHKPRFWSEGARWRVTCRCGWHAEEAFRRAVANLHRAHRAEMREAEERGGEQ